jgi:uncharacterized protein YyaL (SSP411 family)
MERESFENPDIAALMNQNFVSVKVDREERPDVDDVYMKAVQVLTGHGGWPMTVFLTPEGKPFYGGTYFPPIDRHGLPGFPRVLEAVARAYHERPDDISRSAGQILDRLGGLEPSRITARSHSTPGSRSKRPKRCCGTWIRTREDSAAPPNSPIPPCSNSSSGAIG